MDTEKLRVFLQIVESGSVQGAARHLGMTRSALRHSLDGLEAEVGAPLVHRDALGVRLTAAGSVVVEQGRALLQTVRALTQDVRAAAGEARGVLRVIEPVGLPMAMHVRVLLAARMVMPKQQVMIRHMESPVDHLHEPFELMLHEGPPPDKNSWFSRVVVRVPLRPAASRAYLESHGTPQRPEDLVEHETLGWLRPGMRADAWPLLSGGSVTIAPWLSSADPHLLLTLATKGAGIVLAPRMPFFDEPESEPLEPVLADQVGAELVFRVTTPFPAQADSRTRDAVRLIIAQLEDLPQD